MVPQVINPDLDLVLRQLPEYIVILNKSGEIIFFNDEAERRQRDAGRPLTLGSSFLNAVAPDRRNTFQNVLSQLEATQLPITKEVRIEAMSGAAIFFEITYVPILSNNILDKICVITREITSQKIYERKTNQLSHELSLLIEDANAIIFGVDSLGCITDWNKESEHITGFDKSDVFTQKMNSLIDEDSQNPFDELIKKGMSGETLRNQELHLKTREGNLTALVNATPKKNNHNQVIGVLFVGQDITELVNYRKSLEKKVEERTESLKKALQKEKELVDIKNKFVSIASHEFKMPLSSISSSSGQLKSSPKLSSVNLEQLANIDKQIAIMRSLLDDVLAAEKNESSKLKADFRRLDLVAFLKNLSEEIVLATNQTHRITARFSQASVLIDSDEKLLRNIFTNLLSNAIKFSPGKDEIHLELNKKDLQVEIVVRDHGIGIPTEDIQRVFEPFNRGGNASSIKGTGLGLSIVKKATEALGGALEVESQPSIGTQFKVKLTASPI